jgi:hypothetical protein
MPFKKHHQITLYISRNSKMDELARMYFRAEGHEYLESDVSRDANAKLKMEEISGQDQTPVADIDGRVVVGYRPDLYKLVLDGKQVD